MSWLRFWRCRQSRLRLRAFRTYLHLEALEDRTLFAVNPIVVENALPGNSPFEWSFGFGTGDPTLQGYATDISVNRGQTVSFKITDTSLAAYRIDVYRMGYYQGSGARRVATIPSSQTLAVNQPAGISDPQTGLLDCGNWSVSASWAVPATATSGIYFAKLTRDDTGGASHVFFIVRDDSSSSELLFQTSDSTWQAYNTYGGESLYTGAAPRNRAYKVSYNRPFATRNDVTAHSFVFNAEYPMVRWLESNGYDVTYTTDVDSDRYGSLIRNHKVFLSVGHDEYWSNQQRLNVEGARDAGVNLAFFSGNESYWKTRWESSVDGSGTPYRTLVCYKETQANAKIDPNPAWTGTWRDGRFSPPADGGRPENSLTGVLYVANGTNAIVVPQEDGLMRFWRNTSIATLTPGTSATLPFGTLGFEFDSALDNGFRPAGLFSLSTTTLPISGTYLLDYGATYGSATAIHNLTLYRASSGALVFGAGTIQWSWGLDSSHDRGSAAADVRMQQATVNLFADMDIQPGTLQPNLTPATASTDTAQPTSVITSPAAGATVQTGSSVTITGTASDAGGGAVAGVEVSVDGGLTWHPAPGRTNWSYTWWPSTPGVVTVRSRAVDDSANLEVPSAGQTVTVAASAGFSIWTNAATPTLTHTDATVAEWGVKFRSDVAGLVRGVRFHKSSANTGTHTGSLWNGGTLLATATFTDETASGWQQVLFSTPVAIAANTTYVVSYHTDVGRVSYDPYYFLQRGVDNGVLHVLADPATGGNGVYRLGNTNFPNASYRATNYWVDVVFSGTATSTNVTTNLSPAVLGQPVTLTALVSAAGTPTGTVTFMDGATTLGTGAVNASGQVSFTSSSLTAGSHAITAVYSGDPNFPASTSAALPQTVVAGTVTTVASSASPSVAGQTVTLTATVSASGTPTGMVTFMDGATTLGTGTLSAGQATFATSSLAAGSHVITAVYGGDATFAGSTSAALTQNVLATPASTITSVASSVSPSALGQDVTFTATVSALSTPTGTVTFKDGIFTLGTVTLNASGQAAFTTAAVAPGTHAITAVYSGNASLPSSTSAPLIQTVRASIWDNSRIPGSTQATGQPIEVGLKFRSDIGGQVLGVRFYKASTNTGTHTGTLWSSTGTLLATATFTNETTSGWQQVLFSTPVTIAANNTYVVSYHTDSGSYSYDANSFASSGVDNGVLHALSDAAAGGNGVTRLGVSGFPTSSAAATNYWVDVVFTGTATSTTVTSSVGPSAVGQTVIFTAIVSSVGVPTGTVTFLDGATTLGTATLNAIGRASFITNSLATGSHSIAAVYGGDGTFTSSTSAPLTQTVLAATTTVVSANVNPLLAGQSVTFTASVSGSGLPTGMVTFLDGATTLGTGTLNASGQATFSTNTLTAGAHPLTVVYGGDATFAGSTSVVVTVAVLPSSTSTLTVLTTSASPSVAGQSVTFTATVNALGAASGTVTFKDGLTTLGTGTLNASRQASFTLSTLTTGIHTITAIYAGDTTFTSSTSAALTQPVLASATSTLTVVTASPSQVVVGQTVTFTGIVYALGTPTGAVQFLDGGNCCGGQSCSGCPLNALGRATFSTNALTAGVHAITAVYTGDGTLTGSTSEVLSLTVLASTRLSVASFSSTSTGFTVHLSRQIDTTVLNLYDTQTGGAAQFGPADVTLVSATTGPVRGSLVIDPDNSTLTFIRTGGLLPTGTYTVTLRSAANGFKDTSGNLLDGNDDGTVGDNYSTTFLVAPSATVSVSIPDFTRGPGTPINVPATATGLPLRLSASAGVTTVSLELRYNPSLLSVTAAAVAGGLPAGASASLTSLGSGAVRVTFNSPTALPAGIGTFVNLTAQVPSSATYASKQLLELNAVLINGGAIQAVDDDGLQVVGYFGDVTGNGTLSSGDATRVLRVAVGLDSGFSAARLADPAVLADISGDGRVNSLDATRVLQEAVGLDRPEIPPLPTNPPTITVAGPDPLLYLPKTFRGQPGTTLTVPVLLTPSDELESADLAISYDVRRLEVVEVRRGSLTQDFDLMLANIDATAGSIRIALGRTEGPIAGRGQGSVVEIDFRIKADAPAGPAIINLMDRLQPTRTWLNEGYLVLNPAPNDRAGDTLDGLIQVTGKPSPVAERVGPASRPVRPFADLAAALHWRGPDAKTPPDGTPARPVLAKPDGPSAGAIDAFFRLLADDATDLDLSRNIRSKSSGRRGLPWQWADDGGQDL